MINLIISDASARRSKCLSLIFKAKPIFKILFIDFCDESHQQGSTHRSVRVGAKLFWHERTNSHRVVRGSLVSRTKNICPRCWLKFKLFFRYYMHGTWCFKWWLSLTLTKRWPDRSNFGLDFLNRIFSKFIIA